MSLDSGAIGLLLYCIQQAGVMLGVGSETIILVAYLMAMRDGVIDAKEAQFFRAVKRVLSFGLFLILISGGVITAGHILMGQWSIIFSAPYLFKWILIGLIYLINFGIRSSALSEGLGQGLAGATWSALFVVHILAPIVTWGMMLVLYFLWLVGFFICWEVVCYIMKGKPGDIEQPVPGVPSRAIIQNIPPQPTPTFTPQPAPVFQQQQPKSWPMQRASVPQVPRPASYSYAAPVTPPATPAPMPAPSAPANTKPTAPTPPAQPPSNLPAIRVMPKTQEDLDKQQNQKKVVQYN
jgi:hypothetical protein